MKRRKPQRFGFLPQVPVGCLLSHRRGLTNGTSPISNDLAAGVEVISIKHPSDKSEGEPAQGTAKRKRSDMPIVDGLAKETWKEQSLLSVLLRGSSVP